MLTSEERRVTVRSWSNRKIRWYCPPTWRSGDRMPALLLLLVALCVLLTELFA
jgi:hypothetical protein